MMRTVQAIATRSGDWWAVEVPDVAGVFTQARRLDQVPTMAADAIRTLTGEDVEVIVRADLSKAYQDELVQVRRDTAAAQRAAIRAAQRTRRLVGRLRDEGLTVRDIATLLEVSPQRVSQLAAEREPVAG